MIPGVHIYIDGVIKEGDKVVKKVRKQKGHSFVKQFAQILLTRLAAFSSSTTLDITNTARADYPAYSLDIGGAANDDLHGLVIGSNATGVTINDYTLNTKIAHGVNAGQLQYSAVTAGLPTSDTTSSYFVITRVFTNGSGGNVSINEIGIYAYQSVGYYFCLSRDVLAATITLTNGQNLTLNYTIKATI